MHIASDHDGEFVILITVTLIGGAIPPNLEAS